MQIIIKVAILFSMVMVACNGKEFGKCTSENDAMNMMIVAQVSIEKLKNDHANKKLTSGELHDYMNVFTDAGRMINKKKYQEACNMFITNAKEYGFDLQKSHKTIIPVESLDSLTKKGECGGKEATITFMLFTEEVKNARMLKHKVYRKVSKEAALYSIQNPNLLCQNIKKASMKLGISYESLIQKMNRQLSMREKDIAMRKQIVVENKKCSVNDAIELYYKKNDLKRRFNRLKDEWKYTEKDARYARLYDSVRIKGIRNKKKEVSRVGSDFSYEFEEKVKIHITDTKSYDKACENYKILEVKYTNKLLELKEIYNQFSNKIKGK